MNGVFFYCPSGRAFAIVARSGSYSITATATPPEQHAEPANWGGMRRWHPLYAGTVIIHPLDKCDLSRGLGVLVRDPVERFRSACARQRVTVEEGLARGLVDGHFWSLDHMGLLNPEVTHFRFPDQINECAKWLGLPTPVPQMNEEPEEAKPVLTAGQEQLVRQIYASDCALFDSLQP